MDNQVHDVMHRDQLQLSTCSPPGRRSAGGSEPGAVPRWATTPAWICSMRGSARLLVVAHRRFFDLLRHISPEDAVVGRDRCARPVRRVDPRTGTSVYLETVRPPAARFSGSGGSAARRGRRLVTRSEGIFVPGLYRTTRSIEATAQQQESLVTLGTLAAGSARIDGPGGGRLPGRRRATMTPARRFCPPSPAGPSSRSAARRFAALDALRREIEPCAMIRPRSALADPHRGPVLVAWPERRRRGSAIAPPPRPGSISPGASGRRLHWPDRPWNPGWSGWRARFPLVPCCRR